LSRSGWTVRRRWPLGIDRMLTSRHGLALMWLVQAQFAGYVIAQQQFPALKLVTRDLATPPLEALARDEAEFGVVSPDHALPLWNKLAGSFFSRCLWTDAQSCSAD
jgi:hypothetical protein